MTFTSVFLSCDEQPCAVVLKCRRAPAHTTNDTRALSYDPEWCSEVPGVDYFLMWFMFTLIVFSAGVIVWFAMRVVQHKLRTPEATVSTRDQLQHVISDIEFADLEEEEEINTTPSSSQQGL